MKKYIKEGVIKTRNQIVCKDTVEDVVYNVYNPSEERVLADGWEIYTEPAETVYKARVAELIRERYSLDDELAILRQRDSKPEEFAEYDSFAEQCKQTARNEIESL